MLLQVLKKLKGARVKKSIKNFISKNSKIKIKMSKQKKLAKF